MKILYLFKQRFLTVSMIFFAIATYGQEPRPGIECGCTKYDNYVEPASMAIKFKQGSTVQKGSSPKGKYTMEVVDAIPPNSVNISIFLEGRMIFNESNRATDLGFSPDEDRFVMHGLYEGKHWCRLVNLDPDPTREGEQAVVNNVITPIDISSSGIRFSPHGKYLLYAAVSGITGGLFLKVFNAKTGLLTYDVLTDNLIGSPLDTSYRYVAGWGFSPDTKDATFVYAYMTDIDRYTVVVKNLESPDGEYVLFAPNMQGKSHWFFSPCGDYFAWIIDSPQTGLTCRLYRTDSEDNYQTVSAETWWKLFSAADGHYIRYNDNSVLKITDNTADETCPDKSKPAWEGANLETGLIEGTTIELIWNGAKDNVGVTAYKIYKDNSLVEQLEAINNYIVTKLEPDSSFIFRVEAGDETGNWSTDGPEETFSTYPDNPPYWPGLSLTSKDMSETRVTLKWDPAGDDYGILFYKILVNGAEVGLVGCDTLTFRVKGLIAATTDTFKIAAGDAAGQWTAGPQLIITMPPAVPPYWPGDAVLSDTNVTETSMVIKWPAAIDNFNAISRYKISMNGDSLTCTKSYITELLVKDLEEGTVYFFEVIAYDESGNPGETLEGYLATQAAYVLSPLITDPSNQKHPDISGNLIVWWDDRNDGGDIYSYDLTTDSMHRITTDPYTQTNPAVDGERIVWTDARNGNLDIYMYDPVLGEFPVCTASGDQDWAAINGDIIVWRDDRERNWDIYMYDISTMHESPVCITSSNQNWPDVSSGNIVYADDRNGNWDIYIYNIYTKKEISVCTDPADQTFPTITGRSSDLAITYMDDRNKEKIYIYYPDIFLGIDYEYSVPLSYNSIPASPHFEDKQLVWQDLLPLSDGFHNSIWAYKFTGKVPFPGDKKITIGSDNQINQTHPRTSKGNIVWQYDKGTDTDIYVWRRPRGSDLQLSLEVHPDPAGVGDTIKYILTLINDGPNNNLFIRTTVALPLMAKYISATKDKGEVIIEGKNITWKVDTLRSWAESYLEITLLTFDLAILEFRAETKGEAFETDPSNNQVYIKTKVKNVVARDVDEGGTPAMVVEDNGKVHLSYFRNDTLIYAFKNRLDRKWEYRKLSFCDHAHNIAMARASDGNIHVVYSDYNREWYPASRLFHGVITPAGEWSLKIIGVSDRGFHNIALDVTSDGELYLAWLEAPGAGGPTPVMIRRTANGAWQPARIVFEEGFESVDLHVDMEDNVHLSFYHLSNKSHILYQKWSSDLAGPIEKIEPEWGSFPAGMEVFVTAKGTSVTTNNINQPFISYTGYANNDPLENINYAWKQNNTWHFRKVDEGNYNHSVNKLAINQEGILNFGYYHYPAKQLRFATNIAETWVRQIIDDDTTARWNLDMEMDGDHYGHLALGVTYGGLVYPPLPFPPPPDPSWVKYVLIPPLEYFSTDPDSLDFGAVETGSEKTLPLILSNPSEENITVDTLFINDPRFRFNKISFVLKRLSEDTVYVTFSQTENKGLETCLSIVYNNPSDIMLELPVRVSSWGPNLVSDPDTVIFGAVPLNTTATQTISLQNNGLTDLIFSNLEVKYELWPGYPIETDFTLAGHNCSTLEPGKSCEVQVSFKPVKDGTQNSFLNISSNDPETPEMKISIIGNTPFAEIFTKKNSIDFGFCPVDAVQPDTLILFNTGDTVLNITSINLSGSDADQFSFTGSSTMVLPGDSCSIQVLINPKRTDDFIAELVITSNSLWSGVLNIPLSGTSFIRTMELSTENINFGDVYVGDQSIVLLELRNTGSVDINIDQITLNGPDRHEFKHNHACYQIPAGATCIDTVWFFPIFEGEKTGSLGINSNDSYKPVQTVLLTGRAGSLQPPQASLYGHLFDETGSNSIDKSNVILIPASDISDTSLSILDGTNSYYFPGLESGQFTMLAIPDSLTYPQYLPTYFGDKLALYEATWITVTGHVTGKDIYVLKKPGAVSGKGQISGKLVQGMKKGLTIKEKSEFSDGQPVPDVYVYLLGSADSKLKSYDITSFEGDFRFDNLENGSYWFITDYMGKPMSASNAALEISDMENNLEILAVIGTDSINIDVLSGIKEEKLENIKVYPIPAGEILEVMIPNEIFEGKTIYVRIIDMLGKQIFLEQSVPLPATSFTINIGHLHAGIYLMQIDDSHRSCQVKIVKMK